MLIAAFPNLKNTKFAQLMRRFFRSPVYCFLVAALMAVSEIFSLELPVYYIYLALAVFFVFFCDDMLGAMPIVCCGYMTFSAPNNPGKYPETSIFRQSDGIMQLAFVLTALVLLLLGRLVVALIEQPRKRVPRLTCGFAALGVAYLLAGAFSEFYEFHTVLFGFVEIISLAFFYLVFYYTVDWRNVNAGYFATVFFAVGAGMVAEVVAMYFLPDVFVDGQLDRGALYTGWGVYNNVGCIMAMCMPAPFYFAATKKNGWLYSIAGCVFFLAVVLTQSRGSVLSAVLLFVICAAAVLIRAKKFEKLWNGIVLGAFVLALGITLAIRRDAMEVFFVSLFKSGMNSSGRLEIYKNCWDTFLAHPAFGVGFYATPGYVAWQPGAFVPPRAHDTYFQLLASGGVVAMLAYLYHRGETVWVFFRHPTTEKSFAFFCICGLIFTSILDCNFFNIGPGLLYGVLLACGECTDPFNKLYREQKRK